VPETVTVQLPDTAGLAAELAQDEDREALLELEFEHVPDPTDFSFLVFVNTPTASPDTPVTDPGFIGTVSFFPAGVDHQEPDVVRLPARHAIERINAEGPLSVTLVPVPFPNVQISPRDLGVTVTAAVVQSEGR
jgi:hypothetical protein